MSRYSSSNLMYELSNLTLSFLGDMAVTIIKGPIGVVVGIIYGFVAGIFLWYFPSKDCVSLFSFL